MEGDVGVESIAIAVCDIESGTASVEAGREAGREGGATKICAVIIIGDVGMSSSPCRPSVAAARQAPRSPKQDDSTSLMLFRIPRLLSDISQVMTLEKGDVILTGTSKGAGGVEVGDTIKVGVRAGGKELLEGKIEIEVAAKEGLMHILRFSDESGQIPMRQDSTHTFSTRV